MMSGPTRNQGWVGFDANWLGLAVPPAHSVWVEHYVD